MLRGIGEDIFKVRYNNANDYALYLGMNNSLAETYGPSSKCFDAVDRWTIQAVGSADIYLMDDPGCGCYQASYKIVY